MFAPLLVSLTVLATSICAFDVGGPHGTPLNIPIYEDLMLSSKVTTTPLCSETRLCSTTVATT
jgi:hypothetical protein